MLSFLPGPIRCILAMLCYCLIVIILTPPFMLFAVLECAAPSKKMQRFFDELAQQIGFLWIDLGRFTEWLLVKFEIEVSSDVALNRENSYLLIANHQSALDILLLQDIFRRKIAFGRYFIKKSLVNVPLLGWCWKAWCIPMGRYTKEQLARRPQLLRQDVIKTQKICDRLKGIPITLISFIEGTRFSTAKKILQASPYQYLLKPKAGGLAYALATLGSHFDAILDVTLSYPNIKISLWNFFSGRIKKVKVAIRKIPITSDLLGDYENDQQFRGYFQQWLSQRWQEKDQLLQQLKSE